jgi:hypothetical protein
VTVVVEDENEDGDGVVVVVVVVVVVSWCRVVEDKDGAVLPIWRFGSTRVSDPPLFARVCHTALSSPPQP